MGKLLFGRRETITCIADISLRGPKDEPLCIAYKTTGYFVAAGVYLADDGYVLGVKASSDSYIPLPPERLTALQGSGSIPTPLPPYSVSAIEYLFGYSLWIVLAVLGITVLYKQRSQRVRQAEDMATPTSLGPPEISTEADRYIAEQTSALTRPGEVAQHQAYALDRDPSGTIVHAAGTRAFWAVLTDQRLLLINTRVGAFGLLLENRGAEEIERAEIAEVEASDQMLVVKLVHGGDRTLFVPFTKKVSNQRAFLRDLPRLLARKERLAAA